MKKFFRLQTPQHLVGAAPPEYAAVLLKRVIIMLLCSVIFRMAAPFPGFKKARFVDTSCFLKRGE
jgi:hypothetical protein